MQTGVSSGEGVASVLCQRVDMPRGNTRRVTPIIMRAISKSWGMWAKGWLDEGGVTA